MDKPDYSRGFDAGRESVLRNNKSGCCCLFNEDDEIVELCMAHKEHEQKGQIAIKALDEINASLFSSGPHYENIEKILKIIKEYEGENT